MRYVLLAVLMLAGCTSFSVFDEKLPGYVGKPIEALASRLGYPNNEQNIMGRKVYTWNTQERYTSVESLSCSLRVFADNNNRILSYEYQGNNGTCFRYANRL